jgi:hypothetical protein
VLGDTIGERVEAKAFETMLRRMLARRQSFARLSRHRDVVTRLALSFADDHLEHGRGVFG